MYENTALNSTSICFLTHRAGVSVEKQVPTGAFPSLHPRRVWQVGAFSPPPPQGGDLLSSHFHVVVILML